MQKKIREYVIQNRMMEKGQVVVAGISGGGDSVAMLDVLRSLCPEMGCSLWAVHVHHGIRGAEADRDMEFVRELCQKWQIPLSIYAYSVPDLAGEWKTGLEEAGRRVRRQAFAKEEEKFLEKGQQVRIALAHHQDDLAETVLHHLARGSGLRGLGSMRPVSQNRIRPFLCLRRKEIDHYLKDRNLPFVTDSTNLETDYTRNRIRHQILPLMETGINEQTVAHLAETARVAAMAEDYFTKKGKELLEICPKDHRGILLDEKFFQAEEVIQSYGIQEAFFALSKKRQDFTSFHIKSVQELFFRQTGKECMLPYDLTAKREYAGVRIRKKEIPKPEQFLAESGEWDLTIPGKLCCLLGSFDTEIFFYQGQKISEKKYTKWMDYDKIRYHLSVRTRRAGDFLVVDGKGSHKKLSRCMIDQKIPQEERDRFPLVVCGSEVLWIVGGRMNERYKITSETRRVLEIRYQGGYENERNN